MARLRNFSLTPAMTEALVLAAEGAREDLLKIWGREFLPGGFTKTEAIRERLIGRIRSDANLDERIIDLLRSGTPLCRTSEVLSHIGIQLMFHPLSVTVGRDAVLVALLLDGREKVYKWAAEIAVRPALPPATDEERELAQDIIVDFLEDRVLIPAAVEREVQSREPLPPLDTEFVEELNKRVVAELTAKEASQRERIERLNRELQQQKQRYLAKLKEESDAAERDKKALRAETAAAQQRLNQAIKEKQELEAKLKEVSASIEGEVHRQLQEQTSALVRKWLAEPVRAEAALAESQKKSGALSARVEQVLQAQAQRDRHSGTRLELEQQLELLRRDKGRLTAALSGALSPLAEIRPLLGELEAEISRLERALTGAKTASELGAKMLLAINTAESWEEVRGCSQLIEQLADRSMLASEELRSLYNQVQRKFSLLDEGTRPKGAEGDSGWSLRDTLFRNKDALLLLDGHNLLFNLKDIFSPDYESGYPGRKARQRLVDVVVRLVKGRPNVRTKICFDGPDPGTSKITPNIDVVYSGGTGEHRADELIVSNLQFKDLKSLDQKVFVVTDDRQVRRGILQTGAKYVPIDLFAVFLNDFKCLS